MPTRRFGSVAKASLFINVLMLRGALPWLLNAMVDSARARKVFFFLRRILAMSWRDKVVATAPVEWMVDGLLGPPEEWPQRDWAIGRWGLGELLQGLLSVVRLQL
eukprot:9897155-Alexandrium_andersonii.AAC.1